MHARTVSFGTRSSDFEALMESLRSARAMPFRETAEKMTYLVNPPAAVEDVLNVSRMGSSWRSYSSMTTMTVGWQRRRVRVISTD